MVLVRNTMTLPGGDPVQARASVDVELHSGGWHGNPAETEIIGRKRVLPNSTGMWSLDLTPNGDISPATTFYRAVEKVGASQKTHDFLVPGPVAFTGGSRTSNVVTLTGLPVDHGIEAGDSLTVSAPTDSSYNGTFTVTTANPTSIVYPQTAANDASSGAGTIVKSPWDLFDILVDDGFGANPAFALDQLVTKAEVLELMSQGAAGYIRSLNPKSTILPFLDNTTTEISMLNAAFAMPKVRHEMCWRVVASGVIRNVSGSAKTFTFRLRNTTDGAVLAGPQVTLASDATVRHWRAEFNGEGNEFLAPGANSHGIVVVNAAGADPTQIGLNGAIITEGSDPQLWDLTCQASAADPTAEVTVYSAQIMYALAGE